MPARSAARRARSRYTLKWRASAACRAGEQLAERTADRRTQRREALAGARLDERAANHQIDLALRLGPRDQPTQALRIAARRQPLRHDPQLLHERGDLLVMPQLLAGETRHLVGEFQILGVGEHQSDRGRSRLFFAVGVIDQQHVAASAEPARSRPPGSAPAAADARRASFTPGSSTRRRRRAPSAPSEIDRPGTSRAGGATGAHRSRTAVEWRAARCACACR